MAKEYLVFLFIFFVLIIVGIIYSFMKYQNDNSVNQNQKFTHKMLFGAGTVAVVLIIIFFLVVVANSDSKKKK